MTATPLIELRPRSATSPALAETPPADRGRASAASGAAASARRVPPSGTTAAVQRDGRRARIAGRAARPGSAPDDRRDDLVWRSGRLELHLRRAPDGPVMLGRLVAGSVETVVAEPVPLVDALVAAGPGAAAGVGADLRYVAHSVSADGATLVVVQATPAGIRVTATLRGRDGALRSTAVVTNDTGAPVRVEAVTCWAAPLGVRLDKGDVPDPAADWELLEGRVDASGAERWSVRDLRSAELLPCPRAGGAEAGGAEAGGAEAGRGSVDRASGAAADAVHAAAALPVAALLSERQEVAWLWEVAADGPWRWQLHEGTADCRLALSRPAHADPAGAEILAPGASTAAASALVAVGTDLEDAAAAMTRARRAERLASGAVPSDRMHDATAVATAALSTLPEETVVPVHLRSGMTTAETTAALVAGLAGALRLDADGDLRPDQRALAADAVRVADDLRDGLARSVPLWPRGVPAGGERWTCTARDTGEAVVVAIGDRGDDADAALLSFPSLVGRRVDVAVLFPRDLADGGADEAADGGAEWDAVRGILTVRSAPGGPSARLLELRRRS
ncbi:hypothetical protein PED38_08205 [Clavibacter sp. CT19]|uniref:hypothetical protein n=1 Tax=Clavibacter sp. CT19 TaxID=3018990 RepID=UPI0022EA640D|nr:hypothetical protein [Clavibacter sp. CT19]MDA3804777.1 hypothetical protein [Clavibacter sp. CT19]